MVHETPCTGGGRILREVRETTRHGSGSERHELLEQAAVERQRLDLLVIDHLAELARRAADELRFADDGDLFGDLADFQRHVEPGRLRNLQHDA